MKPLHPLQMEALCRYCQNEVQPVLGHSMGEMPAETPISREHALKIICRPMFVICMSKLMEERKVILSNEYEM